MNRILAHLAMLAFVATAFACGDDSTAGVGGGGAVDAACESDEDCKEGLECDDHDGEATCQEPH
jgi:hypothetical protein